jgi:hypothetical protein
MIMDRLMATTMTGGGDNNEALLSILQAFWKLMEGGYAKMVRCIATNRKLENRKAWTIANTSLEWKRMGPSLLAKVRARRRSALPWEER